MLLAPQPPPRQFLAPGNGNVKRSQTTLNKSQTESDMSPRIATSPLRRTPTVTGAVNVDDDGYTQVGPILSSLQSGPEDTERTRSVLFILNHVLFNPLKPSVIMWLHFECSAPYRPNLPFLISDIRALWRSGPSARVPECQTLTSLAVIPSVLRGASSIVKTVTPSPGRGNLTDLPPAHALRGVDR